MSKRDGRSISHEAMEEIRIRAVQRVEAGESPEVVIKALGFSRPRIYEWMARYREGGLDALRAKPVPGPKPKLDGKALDWLYRTITLSDPQRFKFEFALWTRAMVRSLIRERFNVALSEVSVGRLLRKLGLSPQRPLIRAYQRDPELVSDWIKNEFPKIRAEAKTAGAEIFFADEAQVRSDYHSGTTWAPVGQTPIVKATGARFKLNLISAISPKGQLRFMCTQGNVTADVFIDFLKRLIKGRDKPIYLVVDGHPVHRSAKVARFVEKNKQRLRLFSAAVVFTRSQSGRARLGTSEKPQDGTQHHQRTRPDEKARHWIFSLTAKDSRSSAHSPVIQAPNTSLPNNVRLPVHGLVTFVDLFCGGGLGARGAVRGGGIPLLGLDAWDLATKTYKANFPGTDVITDLIENVDTNALGKRYRPDVLLTSPECTSHSIARGAKPGLESSRETAIGIVPWVKSMKPRWLIVENVNRMKKWDRHNELVETIEGLGYTVSDLFLNSADFGSAQARKRMFLVCDKQGSRVSREQLLALGLRNPLTAHDVIDWNANHISWPLRKSGRAKATLERADRAIASIGKNVPFILVYYGSDYAGGWQPLNVPLRTVTTVDRFGLVTWRNGDPYLRMLQPKELLRAMGGGDDHVLPHGSRREKVKLCGNGVCSDVMTAIFEWIRTTQARTTRRSKVVEPS